MARIYQTQDWSDAQVRVALVDNPGEADLWAYRVSSWGLASGDALWFITRVRDDATARILFCDRGSAELLVAFVDSRGQAGWQRRHRSRGRLR